MLAVRRRRGRGADDRGRPGGMRSPWRSASERARRPAETGIRARRARPAARSATATTGRRPRTAAPRGSSPARGIAGNGPPGTASGGPGRPRAPPRRTIRPCPRNAPAMLACPASTRWRTGASATKLPTPCTRRTSPWRVNEVSASRTVSRFTPYARARTGSAGRRLAGGDRARAGRARRGRGRPARTAAPARPAGSARARTGGRDRGPRPSESPGSTLDV